MSRGAPRGRGRGGGRGGGNAARDQFNAAFAGMGKDDARAVFESFSKPVKGSGMLYPPLDKAAEIPGATEFESRAAEHSNKLVRDLVDGPVGPNGQRSGAPWRLASERKVVGVEIESYSDRYRRPTTSANGGTTTLDASVLHMDGSLFPPALWAEYFDPASATSRRGKTSTSRAEAQRLRKKRLLEGGEEEDEKEEEDEEGSASEGDFDFDDEEEEDHQDYDHNYFDNGEGDDDSGGEGGEDEGGRYDD